MDFSIEELKVQDSIGCCITNEGELKYFVNGQDRGVGWKNVPTDRPLWGFADLYGLTRKVKSEFTFGERVVSQMMYLQCSAMIHSHCHKYRSMESGFPLINRCILPMC